MNKGTEAGTREEKELVQKFNSKKDDTLWNTIKIDMNQNHYAVRCSNKKNSRVSNQKVSPKTDVFLIKTTDEIVMDNYYLDEDILEKQKIQYDYIMDSGISVKEKESKSYTIQKMTIETFYKVFENYELGCAIEYYTTEKDYSKNPTLEKAWNTNKEKIIDTIDSLQSTYSYPHTLTMDSYQNIKRSAIKLTEHIINNNVKISNYIFKGIGAFENPFYALFIYKNSELSLNDIPLKYSITTGSGRSNGAYTVVIKP